MKNRPQQEKTQKQYGSSGRRGGQSSGPFGPSRWLRRFPDDPDRIPIPARQPSPGRAFLPFDRISAQRPSFIINWKIHVHSLAGETGPLGDTPPGPAQPRHDRSPVDTKRIGNFFVGKLPILPQDQDVPELFG